MTMQPLEDIEDDVLADGEDLDGKERAALHTELDASIAEAKAGKLIDADVVLAELRGTS